MKDKKLYSTLPKDFCLIDHVGIDNNVVTRPAGELPFMYWPDGVPCIEANVYMGVLLRRGVSLFNKGGTALTYGKNISHLIRFCFYNKWELIGLDDARFTVFINSLQARNALGNLHRKASQVVKIGRACIDFLQTLQLFHGLNKFIGPKSCSINVTEREYKEKLPRGRVISRFYWTHESFPNPSPAKVRLPIGMETVGLLKKEALKTKDKGLRARKLLMIASFEQLGGRVGEVHELSVESITAASRENGSAPMLRMRTLKRKTGEIVYREVPIPRTYLQQAVKYISRYRRKIVKDHFSKTDDHGSLFVCHKKGTPLSYGTYGNEITALRILAGIEVSSHWHLFRHAYITQKLIAIILQHDIANTDEFRKALLNTEAFKQQLQQWTGHTNITSLEIYINFAFAEISNMGQVFNAINLGSSVTVLEDSLSSIQNSIAKSDSSPVELLSDLGYLIEAFKADIRQSVDKNPKTKIIPQ